MTRIPRTMWWADYSEYLASPQWQVVRAGAMERANGLCQRCGQTAKQVHHTTYKRVGGDELPQDLEALCAGCHMRHHKIAIPSVKIPLRNPMQCEALTRKRLPCPIGAMARDGDGRALCHVHHSAGTFQQQKAARRALRAKKKRRTENVRRKKEKKERRAPTPKPYQPQRGRFARWIMDDNGNLAPEKFG